MIQAWILYVRVRSLWDRFLPISVVIVTIFAFAYTIRHFNVDGFKVFMAYF